MNRFYNTNTAELETVFNTEEQERLIEELAGDDNYNLDTEDTEDGIIIIEHKYFTY